jgi:hypothetical protein
VYAARTSADQRVATAEARLAEEIQRRRDAEAERDTARADREQADDATAQAVNRMENLERELAELRTSTGAEVREVRDSAAADVRQARERRRPRHERHSRRRRPPGRRRRSTRRACRAGRRQGPPSRSARHHPSRAAQAAAAEETARIRADHQRALDQLTAATNARIKAVEETRDALRIRAERAETDLNAARAEIHRFAETVSQASDAGADKEPAESTPARPRTASRPKKTAAPRAPRAEA